MSLLNVINLACHQVGRTRCPPSPPHLLCLADCRYSIYHSAMWNYGPLHLVMKSPRSWRVQPANTNTGGSESKLRAFRPFKKVLVLINTQILHVQHEFSPDDTFACEAIMQLNVRLYRHHGKRWQPR